MFFIYPCSHPQGVARVHHETISETILFFSYFVAQSFSTARVYSPNQMFSSSNTHPALVSFGPTDPKFSFSHPNLPDSSASGGWFLSFSVSSLKSFQPYFLTYSQFLRLGAPGAIAHRKYNSCRFSSAFPKYRTISSKT